MCACPTASLAAARSPLSIADRSAGCLDDDTGRRARGTYHGQHERDELDELDLDELDEIQRRQSMGDVIYMIVKIRARKIQGSQEHQLDSRAGFIGLGQGHQGRDLWHSCLFSQLASHWSLVTGQLL